MDLRVPLLLLLTCHLAVCQLKINAWNIQVFGDSKMDKPEVVAILVKTINKYDLVLIQEIRDAEEVAIYELLDACNAANDDPFAIIMSGRLGRTTSTEQYAFFYKPSKVNVVDDFQWDENRDDDKFERPPFVVRFLPNLSSGISEFGFIPCHVKPDDAVAENDALVDVYDGMVEQWGIEDFIIGGDLNFACDYVGEDDYPDIRLKTDDRFVWLIDDDVNTRVRTDEVCAYDRLIITGSNLQNDYVEGSAGVDRFDETEGLTEEEALEVSDHVPVIMDLA